MPGVTKEQIQAAREADLFTYLQFHEPGVLKRDGPNFRHKEHDSLVYVTGKRYWYWNSRGRSINALDYLIQIRGYGLVDAVHALVGGEIRHTPAYRSTAEIQVSKEPEKKAFSLPWARRCATAAVSYLQKRGISSEVIRQCLQAGIFYEARYHGEPVCVFVGKDDSGKAKFACMRSIGGNLKKDVYGSDKGYNFCYPPQSPGSRHVAVFESPIDALSHATLQELLPELTLSVRNITKWSGISKIWAVLFKENLRRQTQKKMERLPGCSKVLSKWRALLYPPLTVMRSGHLIPLPGWNRLRKGALLFWKQCGNRQQKRNRQKSSRHLPMIRKAGNCQVHMKGGI